MKPLLVNEVRGDWKDADAEFVKQSILTDIHLARGAKENDEGWPYHICCGWRFETAAVLFS